MSNTTTEILDGVPIQIEKSSFRLTDDELDVILNTNYFQPSHNRITETCFLLKDPRLIRVRNFLDERMNNYIENVIQINDKFVMTQSWSTITKKGEHHHLHDHPNTIFSLIFYVSSQGAKSGNIVFDFRPSRLTENWNFAFNIKEYNPFNSDTWEYSVNTGDLVIFPAWIPHKTRENYSNNDRIIIGANYFINGNIGSTRGIDKIHIQLRDVDYD